MPGHDLRAGDHSLDRAGLACRPHDHRHGVARDHLHGHGRKRRREPDAEVADGRDLRRHGDGVRRAAPAPAAAPAASAPAPAAAPKADNLITIKSPMIGTFYRRASPDKPLLADVGSEVAAGKVVCIIEAMKLFNEIESEISGTIVKVLVEDASPVEFDQPLFLVEPNK